MNKGMFEISDEMYEQFMCDGVLSHYFNESFQVLRVIENPNTKTIVAISPLFDQPGREWLIEVEQLDVTTKGDEEFQYVYKFVAEPI